MITEKSFLKLHTADINKPFILQDTMFINAIREEQSTKVVYQSDTDMTEEVQVNETPERISQIITLPVLLVHNSEDNRIACVNIAHIRAITPEDGETGIVLFDDTICVNETPEKAHKLICDSIRKACVKTTRVPVEMDDVKVQSKTTAKK